MAFARVRDFFVHLLSCCNEPEEQPRTLQIGHPTNFRKETIDIQGLTPEQQEFFREKARLDALRLHHNSIPIRPARPELDDSQLSSFDFSDQQAQRRSLRDRFSSFVTPSKGHERGESLTGAVGFRSTDSDSFELRHVRHGMNGSRDSVTLHGSDIDPEKMF